MRDVYDLPDKEKKNIRSKFLKSEFLVKNLSLIISKFRAEDVSTDEEIEDYVDKRNQIFLEATNARVQTLLKDHPDVLLGDKKKKNTEPEFNFNFASKK